MLKAVLHQLMNCHLQHLLGFIAYLSRRYVLASHGILFLLFLFHFCGETLIQTIGINNITCLYVPQVEDDTPKKSHKSLASLYTKKPKQTSFNAKEIITPKATYSIHKILANNRNPKKKTTCVETKIT